MRRHCHTKGAQSVTSIPITDILTIIFVLVDDWYPEKGIQWLTGKAGKKPEFKDSEVITKVFSMKCKTPDVISSAY
jgi:hypothetical protein